MLGDQRRLLSRPCSVLAVSCELRLIERNCEKEQQLEEISVGIMFAQDLLRLLNFSGPRSILVYGHSCIYHAFGS
jgi:hypothetical protein